MEDRDTERRHALTERRIRRVEYLVNTFRIAGQGLTGGYPLSRLKEGRSYTHGERIADLGNRFAGFDLRGTNGVQVSGGMQHGFIAQMEVEEEEEEDMTPVTCADQMTVEFSGIVFDCGCVFGQIWTDISINGTFVLDKIGEDEFTCTWATDGGSAFGFFYGDEGCSVGGEEGFSSSYIQLGHLFDPTFGDEWSITYYNSGSPYFFFGVVYTAPGDDPSVLPITLDNAYVCGFNGPNLQVASGGTVVISEV